MRKLSLILFFVLFLFPCLRSQQPGPSYIYDKFDNVPFTEFVSIVKSRYDISIFFKHEWIEDIFISSSSDSTNLTFLLEAALNEKGINVYRRNSKQYFLTGTHEVYIDKIPARYTDVLDNYNRDEDLRELYFNRLRFESSINRVVIGDPNNRNKSESSDISGRIYSRLSKEPVPGATLVIEGSNTGVISNGEGKFTLPARTGSTIRIEVSCMGMEPETFLAEVYNSGNLDIELTEQLIDIDEVIVRSETSDNIRGLEMGFQRISMDQIKEMPTAFGERDVLRAANMTAGVQFTGEGSAGINVRGSSSDQNLFLINDIPVLNTGHMFGFFSAFNPDMLSDFKLYKNNFPAEYGGRLSSIFDISTRSGNMNSFGMSGRISPVTGSLLLEGPVIKNKLSLIAGARSTYSDWILNRIEDPVIRNSNASFNDLMLGVNLVTDNNTGLRLFTYLSNDRFTLYNSNDFDYGNLGASLEYTKQFGENWSLKAAGVVSQYINYHTNRYQPSSAFENEFNIQSGEFKVRVNGNLNSNNKIGIGGNVVRYMLDQGTYDPLGPISLLEPVEFGKESGIESSFHISDEIKLSERFSIYAGLRYSFYSNTGPGEILVYEDGVQRTEESVIDTIQYKNGQSIYNSSGPEYRLAANFVINQELSLKISINRMRQYMFMLSNTISQSPIDRWKLSDSHISPPISDQASFGIYKNLTAAFLETSLEIYFKKDNNIVEYIDGADLTSTPNFETLILQGTNRAAGIELSLRKVSGRLTGWTSYTFSRSFTAVDGDEEWEKINNGISYPSNYDKPHSFKAVSSFRISKRLSFGANLEYNTGRPITYPTELFYANSYQLVNYSHRNEYRIPDYFRIDASINIDGNLKRNKLFHGSWSFSVYNLTGRRNAYSIYFKNEGGVIKGYRQSVFGVPIFTISYNFKLGNYDS